MTDQNEKIDALILEAVPADFTKTALIISKVFDEITAQNLPETPAKEIAERLYVLVDNGRLDVKGNMRRWRNSEIKRIA